MRRVWTRGSSRRSIVTGRVPAAGDAPPLHSSGHTRLPSPIDATPAASNRMLVTTVPVDTSMPATAWQLGYATYMSPVGVAGHATPIVPAGGSATIAAGRERTGAPVELITWRRSTLAPTLASSALPMSSADRSHEPAFAVISKQPTLSVAIAIGSSPTLMPLFPGVSGSASMTLTSPPMNEVDGLVSKRAIATVPGSDCSTNPYQATPARTVPPCLLRSSWPVGMGAGSVAPRGAERKSHDVVGCALSVTICVMSAEPPFVRRRPP